LDKFCDLIEVGLVAFAIELYLACELMDYRLTLCLRTHKLVTNL